MKPFFHTPDLEKLGKAISDLFKGPERPTPPKLDEKVLDAIREKTKRGGILPPVMITKGETIIPLNKIKKEPQNMEEKLIHVAEVMNKKELDTIMIALDLLELNYTIITKQSDVCAFVPPSSSKYILEIYREGGIPERIETDWKAEFDKLLEEFQKLSNEHDQLREKYMFGTSEPKQHTGGIYKQVPESSAPESESDDVPENIAEDEPAAHDSDEKDEE